MRGFFAACPVGKTLGLQPRRAERAAAGLGARAQQHQADFLACLVALAVVLPKQFSARAVLQPLGLACHIELQQLGRWRLHGRRRAGLGLFGAGCKDGQGVCRFGGVCCRRRCSRCRAGVRGGCGGCCACLRARFCAGNQHAVPGQRRPFSVWRQVGGSAVAALVKAFQARCRQCFGQLQRGAVAACQWGGRHRQGGCALLWCAPGHWPGWGWFAACCRGESRCRCRCRCRHRHSRWRWHRRWHRQFHRAGAEGVRHGRRHQQSALARRQVQQHRQVQRQHHRTPDPQRAPRLHHGGAPKERAPSRFNALNFKAQRRCQALSSADC